MNLKDRIVEVRHMALKAECKFMQTSDMDASIEFERIGKKLDKILRAIENEEKADTEN